MKLLQRNSLGGFSLTEDLLAYKIPRYAILSHTWRKEEVTFADLTKGAGLNKAGYQKIQFCGEQAERDGLHHFWVDTCCIDKSNSTELQEAINSMFQWYRDAATCYVYLEDVSCPVSDPNERSDNRLWEEDFRRSRWFRRGWTLQELIAPRVVEFFSKEHKRLGTKQSLERHICDVTGIPASALRGTMSLSEFSIAERIAWQQDRETTREEDLAYSLLGIFDVQISLLYSEGKEKAFRRLREEINRTLKGKLQ
jgi:hypothetical protein